MSLLRSVVGRLGFGPGRMRGAAPQTVEAERLKTAVINAAPDAVVISDGQGRIIEVNPAAERLFGHGPAQLLGAYMSDLIVTPAPAGVDPDGTCNILSDVGQRMTLSGRRAGGETFPAEIAVQRVQVGHRTLFAAYVRDLTAEREAAAALDAQRQQLGLIERMSAISSLLSGVAHELNNPLAILVAQATLLHDKAPTPDVRVRALKIQGAAERASRIVKSFLAMARQKPPVFAALDLDGVVDDALELVGYGLRSAGVAVERHRGEALSPVEGDRDLLGQVCAHLLIEAQASLQGRQEGRRITIRSTLDAGEIVLTIGDNGVGSGPAVAGVGASVGLSLCRSVLDAHHGSMSLDRAPEGGCLARLALPTRRGDGPAVAAAVSPSNLKVLVVDDEIEVGQSLAELIEIFGHRVFLETSPEAALDRIGREAFDLVLTDVRMPGLDGLGLRRAVAARDPAMAARTVLVTGDTVSIIVGYDQSTREPGAVTLEKPFTATDVKTILDKFASP